MVEFPQPLGSTMEVMPGSKRNNIRGDKHLNPCNYSLVRYKVRYRMTVRAVVLSIKAPECRFASDVSTSVDKMLIQVQATNN